MSALPEDVVQLGIDVKEAQEHQARLEDLKQGRQKTLEAMSPDIAVWITKLVGELRQLVANEPRTLNPHNKPLDRIVQVLDPVYGVGFVYDGLRVTYKPHDGVMFVSAEGWSNNLLMDVNEQTVRIEAFKAIRRFLRVDSDGGSSETLALLSDD